MEPNVNSGQKFEAAPQPTAPEQPNQAPLEQAPAAPTPESLNQSGDAASQGPGMVLPPPILKPAPAPQAAPLAQTATGAPAPASTPAIADDVDVIEKEWVEKAKDIVNKNSSDPHKQNEEVSVLKADYMKKRYNKDIKTQNNG